MVSVCCTTFNHQDYIEDAIQGFLIQETSFPFEILVHDDASTDDTAEIIAKYRDLYPSIFRVVAQRENQMSRGHRILAEFLLPIARGKYIAICEGDDFWVDPLKLQKQVAFLEANEDFVICYSDCIGLLHETGESVPVPGVRWDLNAQELQQVASIFTLTSCFRNVIRSWPKELSRSPYGDMLLWTLLGDHGKGKYLENIEPSVYRMHSQGMHSLQSKRRQVTMALETMMVLYLYRRRIGEQELAAFHLENVFVLIVKARGLRLFFDVGRRAWKRWRRSFYR
jgi:glycosyltransferase involved in cell wall biosynthesis